MNKELIKKHKTEFNHWLNEGELLSKHPDENDWSSLKTDEKNWHDIVSQDSFNKFSLENIRIKPEEKYEFKVGDYIRRSGYDINVGKIREIYKDENEKITGFLTEIYFFSIGECKLWKPLKNEYCWFRDDIDDTPIFSKFMHMTRDEVNEEIMWYYAENGDEFNKKYYKICQPFLGRLPEGCK